MKDIKEYLSSYVDALRPIIYINHFDFNYTDKIIEDISENITIIEYNNSLGKVDFKTKAPQIEMTSLEEFLKENRENGFDNNTFIILKDIHNELDNPKVLSILKRISEDNLYREDYYCTIFIVSSILKVPRELENYITILDAPLPIDKEIKNIMINFIKELDINVSKDVINELSVSFKGLNKFQIEQILNLAYQNSGTIEMQDKDLILKEKEQLVKKSSMLEIINFKEGIDDIGGLETLKNWLERKAKIFKNLGKAKESGVDVPKGIMIVGMPGCGKSLTAKVTSSLFNVPLVRLDVGRLLGKYVGESEENMRKALDLAEAISPCVLWIDEIEKAFAGIGSGVSEVTTRLFGLLLTWLQEKENTVFVVATANDISNLPPEFLRKGRFDEIFFTDLPNVNERTDIIKIHLKKRNKFNRDIDIYKLAKETDGYNGADLEYIIKDTIEEAFINNKDTITTDDLLATIKETKSISQTLKTKIENIRKTVEEMDIKKATNKN